jgi:hypothetical protein
MDMRAQLVRLLPLLLTVVIAGLPACDKEESPAPVAAPVRPGGFLDFVSVRVIGNGRVHVDAEPTPYGNATAPLDTQVGVRKDASPWVYAEPAAGASLAELTCDCACPADTPARERDPARAGLEARRVCTAEADTCQCTARFVGGTDFGVALSSQPASPLTQAGPVALHAEVRGGSAPYHHTWKVIDGEPIAVPDAPDVTVTVTRSMRITDDVVEAGGRTAHAELVLTLQPAGAGGPIVELRPGDVPPNVTTASRFTLRPASYDPVNHVYTAVAEVYPNVVDCAWTFRRDGEKEILAVLTQQAHPTRSGRIASYARSALTGKRRPG